MLERLFVLPALTIGVVDVDSDVVEIDWNSVDRIGVITGLCFPCRPLVLTSGGDKTVDTGFVFPALLFSDNVLQKARDARGQKKIWTYCIYKRTNIKANKSGDAAKIANTFLY